jgi:hypothetical protein
MVTPRFVLIQSTRILHLESISLCKHGKCGVAGQAQKYGGSTCGGYSGEAIEKHGTMRVEACSRFVLHETPNSRGIEQYFIANAVYIALAKMPVALSVSAMRKAGYGRSFRQTKKCRCHSKTGSSQRREEYEIRSMCSRSAERLHEWVVGCGVQYPESQHKLGVWCEIQHD